MPRRVEVVLHISGLRSEDGMVFPQIAVLSRKPFSASLAEDDVSGDDVLVAGFFGAETSACGVVGAVCSALGGVGGVADLG